MMVKSKDLITCKLRNSIHVQRLMRKQLQIFKFHYKMKIGKMCMIMEMLIANLIFFLTSFY
jgi:hypothetical protein